MKEITMTAQKIFDKIVTHLRRQNSKSLYNGLAIRGEYTSYAYKGIDGKKCPIGCLIPKNQYNKDIEGLSVIDLIKSARIPALNELHMHSKLLERFQIIHDAHEVSSWESQFKILAKDYSLNYEL